MSRINARPPGHNPMMRRLIRWRPSRRAPQLPWCIAWLLFSPCPPARAAEPPQFFRGLNLNGPAVTIDGHDWEGKDSQHYQCRDKAFENQQVRLVPDTDADRAAMIRSSRWGGNRIELTEVQGAYVAAKKTYEGNS